MVSIIIPTYNRAHLIEKTLESVLSQTYSKWECIVVDDGSTDDTAHVVSAFAKADYRFKYYNRPETKPKGANACRNYGLELSTGGFIQFLDSDDRLLKEKLETQVAYLFNSQYEFTVCQTEWLDVINDHSKGLRSDNITTTDHLNAYVSGDIFFPILAPLWKKSFLFKNDLFFDERLMQSQDFDYHIRAIANVKTYHATQDIHAVMIEHTSNMSNSITDSFEKFYSNPLVRYKVLKKFSAQLSTRAAVSSFQTIQYYYKESLHLFSFQDRFKMWWLLSHSLKHLNFKNRTKLLAACKWLIGIIKIKSYYTYPISMTQYQHYCKNS